MHPLPRLAFPPAAVGFAVALAIAVGGWFASWQGSLLGLALPVAVLATGAAAWLVFPHASPVRRRLAVNLQELTRRRRLAAPNPENLDPLTGLLNHQGFSACLWRAVARTRQEGTPHVLVYLDMDRFRLVNDSCGHSAGDKLLQEISELVADGAGKEAVVARVCGDELAVLFQGMTVEEIWVRTERICAQVREHRFAWGDKVFHISCSMGLVPVDGQADPVQLLAAVNAACCAAKDQGRNRIQVARSHELHLVRHRGDMAWTSRIHRALEQGRLRLRFQRIVPLGGELPTMAELLLTLMDEDGNRVAPADFLPSAERFGLMNAVDQEVVRRVFEQVARAEEAPRLRGIDVFSLNVSGQSLSSPLFLDHCLEALATTGVNPRRICFEITETAVIADLERARIFFEALRGQGCRFALDDFGSGVSSFGYLRSLAVDFLKIDGQFIRHIAQDRVDRSMVAAINEVGHVMGVRTVAEFVETQQIRDELERIGMDYAQGYAVHRPEFLD